jgi:parvulin-like peptidyl-prolyl isomerase
MDAANPLCRWLLLVAGLAAVVGCQSSGSGGYARGRGQVPAEPGGPMAPPRPVTPGARVPGSPASPDVQKAGYNPAPAALARGVELLKDGIPQIKVVAYVGATNLVTDQEVVEAVRQRLGELNGLGGHARKAKEKEMYNTELRRIIERELILDEMYTRLKKAGKMAMIDDLKEFAVKAADQSLRAIRKHYGNASEQEFQDILRTQGLTAPVIRRQLERQFMADEYVRNVLKDKGRTPGLADIRAYYDAHPDEFKTDDRVKWLDIFISLNKHASAPEAYKHAVAVRRQAASGGDFVALVKQYDNGLAVGTNGVGIGSKRGEIQPADVEPAVWALKPGQVSELIQTPVGYHIVKVAEREYAGVRPFDAKVQDEVRETLLRQYREAEYKRMVEDLWRNGPVRVLEHP